MLKSARFEVYKPHLLMIGNMDKDVSQMVISLEDEIVTSPLY